MTDDRKNSIGFVETRTIRVVEADAPLQLQCGKRLGPIDVAYETCGKRTPEGDNVVLICHALSGNAHVAGYHGPDDRKPGWWDMMVGPGKAIDTDKYFVICSNVLGGISGTTGPSSINPATGRRYGLDFPIITIADMVKVQKLLLDKLGVRQLLTAVGGSMGGMQVLQWAIAYPDFVKSAMVVASTTRLSAQAIAFDAVGRNAILADGYFNHGQYHDQDHGPDRGLAIARMIGHITYLSEESMRDKFGRNLRSSDRYGYDFNSEFSVETYLDYQGQTFVERFDANCYLYITKAMDYFDLERQYGSVAEALAGTKARFLVASFTSDWLFTAAQAEEIVDALVTGGKDVSYCSIHSPYGHDAFLLEPKTLGAVLSGFLDGTYAKLHPVERENSRPQPPPTVFHFRRIDQARRARVDYELIDSLIEPASRVLDVGCGDGELLAKLIRDKNIRGEGIELDQELVVRSIQRGLSVIHRDIERGLHQYAADSFDYAILSQTLQTVKDPEKVFRELLRVANRVIISFPNFAHWACRLQLLWQGRAPRTRQLPFRWYDSPNIHCLSLKDFDRFCEESGARVEKRIPLGKSRLTPVRFMPNLFAAQAVYVTSRNGGRAPSCIPAASKSRL
ncbi:MAG: homoserine O-acetyltransferase [Phycisphaerae bacterium]|nr:homoserine O-acetyltransferase [Phycisphaerae bacterium]